MDINDVRAWTTLILIITFVLIVVWAYSKKRKKDFSEAANLPFAEPEQPGKDLNHHRGVQ
jgi:cytochrome c oxidase cbb3-type subunit IV